MGGMGIWMGSWEYMDGVVDTDWGGNNDMDGCDRYEIYFEMGVVLEMGGHYTL